MKLIPVLKSVVLAGALAFAPLAASAATMTLYYQDSAKPFNANGHATATITETTVRPSGLAVNAGGFALKGKLDGVNTVNFTAWCLDISTYLKLPSQYTTTSTPFAPTPISATRLANIERLFETGYSTLDLTSNAQSAGFQLALWEVLYEKSSSYNLGYGNFKVKYSTAAIAAGKALLDNMASGPITRTYDLTYLQSNQPRVKHYSQNLVTATPDVPLPAGGVLLVSALAGLAALRRRRATRA